MIDLKAYTELVERKLSELSLPAKPGNLYDPLRYLLNIGGKRVRPILTLLGAELFGVSNDKVINQALAVELFHNFTLIHDDIMDEAPLRRGQSTVHEKWGNNTAILSGDVLMIYAYEQLSLGVNDHLKDLFERFNRTAIEVCEGQQMDMDFETREDVTPSEYVEMIRLKTSVLLGCALEFGAIMAGASSEDRKHLYDFGVHVGLAFQIQDDILDLYADPEKFGKQVGGDVLADKKTLLFLLAKDNATDSQIAELNALKFETDPAIKVEKTRSLFDDINARGLCEAEKANHYEEALRSLELINVDPARKNKLKGLAAYLLERDK
jgi:geranylgeranyl diphosphate synthase type II